MACCFEEGLDLRAGTGCEGGEPLRAPSGPGARRRSFGPVEMVPMGIPPNPLIPEILLVVAARLGFRVLSHDAAGRELGMMSDSTGEHALVIGGGSVPGACAWTLLDGGPVPKMAYLLSRETYAAIWQGVLAEDGSLIHDGIHYNLRAGFDGIAELTPVCAAF